MLELPGGQFFRKNLKNTGADLLPSQPSYPRPRVVLKLLENIVSTMRILSRMLPGKHKGSMPGEGSCLYAPICTIPKARIAKLL